MSKSIDVTTEIININMPFLLILDVLTKLRVVLFIGSTVLTRQTINWWMLPIRKNENLNILWAMDLLFATFELGKVHCHFY